MTDVLTTEPLLSARAISATVDGLPLVHEIDLDLIPGRILALVGPSGSGKSLTARRLVDLPPVGVRFGGTVERRAEVGYVFQDAMASLNPTITVGRHLLETLRGRRRRDRRAAGLATLGRCGLPGSLWDAHPHELSGGQAQRVALALAIVTDPAILIADEITTALDEQTRDDILALVRDQADEHGRSVLLITHDLAAAARWADEVTVVEAGRVVEHGGAGQILSSPTHRLTTALVAASMQPSESGMSGEAAGSSDDEGVALRCEELTRVLRGGGRVTTALDRLDLSVTAGEAVAVVGRSGAGKSTLVGTLAGLDRPDAGRFLVDGRDVWALPAAERRGIRRRIGLVFQDALASFDPRYTVRQVVAEAAEATGNGASSAGSDGHERVEEWLDRVGLDPALADRRPVTLSGGERQRVAIARALAGGPDVLLADEPTNGLDVLVQDHLLRLLDRLRADLGVTIVLVTHDTGVARRVADRIVTLDAGRIVS